MQSLVCTVDEAKCSHISSSVSSFRPATLKIAATRLWYHTSPPLCQSVSLARCLYICRTRSPVWLLTFRRALTALVRWQQWSSWGGMSGDGIPAETKTVKISKCSKGPPVLGFNEEHYCSLLWIFKKKFGKRKTGGGRSRARYWCWWWQPKLEIK